MHASGTGHCFPLAAAWLAMFPTNVFAAQPIEIKVLSGRPDMVSGGSALLQISGSVMEGVHVTLNGKDVTASFRAGRNTGTLIAKLEELKPGANVVEAKAGGGRAQLHLMNHPIGGPVFSGPHQQPFICQTEFSGLGKAVDADCNAPTRVEYFYKSTQKVRPADAKKRQSPGSLAAGFIPLNPSAELPADIATTTTTDGKKLKFILRLETGTINRGVYRIAFLHEPGQPLPDPWTSIPGWNGRLVYSFGGGGKTGFRQGQAPPPLDLSALANGYAVAGSTLDVLGTNANDVINAETLMMVKEHFIKNYGVPVHTIGTGGSGGAIQQYTIAQNYPGLLDGITPGSSFPDFATILEPILDCDLLGSAFDRMKQPLTPEQRVAVAGYGSWGVCENRNKTSPQWIQAAGCDASMSKDKIYDPVTNPKGVRCSLQDNQANVYGRDPKTGGAPQIFDNVGVQYGLSAFNAGKITAEQFVELNEQLGGFDRDGNFTPARSAGDRKALRTAYETGRVNAGGGSLGSIPIIDYRRYGDLDGNPHDRIRSVQMRMRIERAYGSAANQVLIMNPEKGFDPVRLMDRWLDAIAADPSTLSPQNKAARDKPSGLGDYCSGPNDEKIVEPASYKGPGRCNELYPASGDPRTVAGAPISGEVLKCGLKPVDAKDYKQPLDDGQLGRLRKIFPGGTCDFSRPGVEQTALRQTWITYSDR